ncbi:CheB methylesterase [Crinalium epipsammum PCC 9333]|uniref:protein-glutamate methylesterase n=1 Tax=Crinalium epipsammum PCC 9333 TaxID=1173022 RepID=K9W1F0_9CYAN|nr:chemotaxis protein CheB [Crinalium epipsammum]AFZ14203.1 CheB methylesterase [Crinalium epipsammum PCC 9333]
MSDYKIIVIGASAGGVEALIALVKQLPPDLPAAIFIVLHIPPHGTSVLPTILSRAGKLKAVHPQDGQVIKPGQIYIAPPNNHLLIKRGYITLACGPKENGHRPAVDPLFRTAARVYGANVIGVILSGSLDDGTAGLMAVKMRGGVAIVQNPKEAMFSGMPTSAVENVEVDYIMPLSGIPSLLAELVNQPVTKEEQPMPDEMEIESDIAELEINAVHKHDRPGNPSGFACPACGGSLWEIQEGHLLRFRCRTGHAYSSGTLLAEQSEALEEALWIALRALEESSALAAKLADKARDRQHNKSAERFDEQSQDAQKRANVIREALLNDSQPKGLNHRYGNGQLDKI